jgi:hypothetical protein
MSVVLDDAHLAAHGELRADNPLFSSPDMASMAAAAGFVCIGAGLDAGRTAPSGGVP